MKTVYLDSCSRKIKRCWLCNINEHRLLKTNYCISSINEKMFRDKPTKQIHNWTHSQQQKKKKWSLKVCFEIMSNEIEDVFQYLWCEQSKVCFEIMPNETEDMFRYYVWKHYVNISSVIPYCMIFQPCNV